MFFQTVGMFLGAPVAGYLREATGDYRVPFVIAGSLFAFCGLAMGSVTKYLLR